VATDELVRSVSARIAESRGRRAWSRVAFAGALSTVIVGMVASFGALGYAKSGAAATYSTARQIVVTHKLTVHVRNSSAASQYPGTPPPPKTQSVAGASKQHANAVAGVAAAKTLPFTGLSLLVTVLIGATLLALGLILRRRERSDS
jgi:hypothetical protein